MPYNVINVQNFTKLNNISKILIMEDDMNLFSAFKKILKRKGSQSYYNSDLALTLKEKQSFVACIFFIVFLILIIFVMFLLN